MRILIPAAKQTLLKLEEWAVQYRDRPKRPENATEDSDIDVFIHEKLVCNRCAFANQQGKDKAATTGAGTMETEHSWQPQGKQNGRGEDPGFSLQSPTCASH